MLNFSLNFHSSLGIASAIQNLAQEVSSLSFQHAISELLLGIAVPAQTYTRAIAMKNSKFKENFRATNFVKPLYRVRFVDVKPKLYNDKTKLVGNAFNLTDATNVTNVTLKDTQKWILPGVCEEIHKNYDLKCDRGGRMEQQQNVFSKGAFRAVSNNDEDGTSSDKKHISFNNPLDLILDEDKGHQETWLRVHPAPILEDESVGSIILRFMACQLGITAFLVFWTAFWVAVIHAYEGPHEDLINEEYEQQQNQLVIDLATELRTITPISPKWHKAISARVEQARQQTMIAAGRGAKLEPGSYWNLAGTFLFTVYVMTALGFGAPVPQTVEGRCFALLYAVFAVPFHVYLMMQASTCAVAHVNHYLAICQNRIQSAKRKLGKETHNSKDSAANIDLKGHRRRKRISRLVSCITTGHCVPLASLVYYAIGVVIFGLGRYRKTDTVDVLMFPLQFTTNGGLASVESHFRVLYGLYVEGAMALLTCSLAALRRYSGNSVSTATEKYRLFTKG